MNNVAKRIRNVANETIRKLNPHFFGSAMGSVRRDGSQLQQDARKALGGDQSAQGRAARSGGNRVQKRSGKPVLRIGFIVRSYRSWDSDNLRPALKGMRDAIAQRFGLDDNDETIEWEYAHVITRGECGVIVRIEAL